MSRTATSILLVLTVFLAGLAWQGSARAACIADTDCTAPQLNHCDTTLAPPACVQCRTDGDCAAPSVCERDATRASFSKCVACTKTEATACDPAGAGSACLAAGSCGCILDDDCGPAASGRVCAGSGTCAIGCRGDGSRGCSSGQICSATGAEVGTCVSAGTGSAGGADAGVVNPSPPLAGGGNCAVAAAPGSGRDRLSGMQFGAFILAVGAWGARRRRRVRPVRSRGLTSLMLRSLALALVGGALGCSHTPSPLTPLYNGSVGLPHKGVLASGAELEASNSLRFLRENDRRYGLPRFVSAIQGAADRVARERPGGILTVGDLSAESGGVLLPHLSHRNGRDADLLLFMTTLEGAPVASPGFIHVREDGLAWDDKNHRFLRLDVERQWLLLKALLEDETANIQFVFCSKTLRLRLAEWAIARGETYDLVYRAMTVLVQPHPGGEHDDHFHVRTACTDDEVDQGCEPSGPARPWLASRRRIPPDDDQTLVMALLQPLDKPSPADDAMAVLAAPTALPALAEQAPSSASPRSAWSLEDARPHGASTPQGAR